VCSSDLKMALYEGESHIECEATEEVDGT
jgi:hypothetical protein